MKKVLDTIKRKWPEYILEVLVITIGVLGAFTLNNWNENSKDRKIEREYLENLKTELNANKVIALSQIEFSKFQEANAHLILTVMFNDTTSHDLESILVAIEHVGWNQSLSYFQQNTWQELFSTGNMNLIQNKNLRAELSNLYREINL